MPPLVTIASEIGRVFEIVKRKSCNVCTSRLRSATVTEFIGLSSSMNARSRIIGINFDGNSSPSAFFAALLMNFSKSRKTRASSISTVSPGLRLIDISTNLPSSSNAATCRLNVNMIGPLTPK